LNIKYYMKTCLKAHNIQITNNPRPMENQSGQ
jgi:hypothetical protein